MFHNISKASGQAGRQVNTLTQPFGGTGLTASPPPTHLPETKKEKRKKKKEKQ